MIRAVKGREQNDRRTKGKQRGSRQECRGWKYARIDVKSKEKLVVSRQQKYKFLFNVSDQNYIQSCSNMTGTICV